MRHLVTTLMGAVVVLLAGIAGAKVSMVTTGDVPVLTPGDLSVLQSESARWPFELRVLSGSYGSKRELGAAVHECVSAPNVVCVGIDPAHRYTETHFGNMTGVRPNDYNLVGSAGNSAFHDRQWRVGIERIADRANESIHSAAAVTVVQPTIKETESYAGVWISLFAVVAALLAVGIIWRWRKRQAELERTLRDEGDEYRSRNIEEASWHDRMRDSAPVSRCSSPTVAIARPVYTTSTTVVQQQSSSAMSNLASGAVGFELGRMEQRLEDDSYRHRTVDYDPAPTYVPANDSSSDAGGGGSSWTDDYSSNTDTDSGGGGSSFDFGDVFSGGGGGSDGGGGGFDF